MAAVFQAPESVEESRGERTRAAILKACRQLFLTRGYAGTPINAITQACGISRAGFYTYFKDKREVFTILGEAVYRDLLTVLAEWDVLPKQVSEEDMRTWVGHFFDYMDVHGAFALASVHSAPDDPDFVRSRNRTFARGVWTLGSSITARSHDNRSPDVVGVVALAMLERSWFSYHRQSIPLDRDEVIESAAAVLYAMTRPAD